MTGASGPSLIKSVSAYEGFDLYVPNIFTPNGDGKNDYFSVTTSSPLKYFQIFIFDRWGNEVFSADQIDFKWNGKFHDKILLPGVYTYLITVEENGKNKTSRYGGDVTILL